MVFVEPVSRFITPIKNDFILVNALYRVYDFAEITYGCVCARACYGQRESSNEMVRAARNDKLSGGYTPALTIFRCRLYIYI